MEMHNQRASFLKLVQRIVWGQDKIYERLLTCEHTLQRHLSKLQSNEAVSCIVKNIRYQENIFGVMKEDQLIFVLYLASENTKNLDQ